VKQAVITVTGKDGPGIIADVTGILYASGSNLEDVSMTILEGELSMIMIVGVPGGKKTAEIKKKFEQYAGRTGMMIYWKDLSHKAAKGSKHAKGSRSYILSASGKDRTGIVYEISRLFAGEKLNITDLNSRILPSLGRDLYVLMLEVDLPRGFRAEKLQKKLAAAGKKIGMDIQFKPVERIEF